LSEALVVSNGNGNRFYSVPPSSTVFRISAEAEWAAHHYGPLQPSDLRQHFDTYYNYAERGNLSQVDLMVKEFSRAPSPRFPPI
jgi:hypothetical protein